MNVLYADWRSIPEYRHGRNFVHVGDVVKVKPPRGTSWLAKVKAIKQHPETGRLNVEVTGLRGDEHHYGTYTKGPEQIKRVAQTKNGEGKYEGA